jgi:hypothetical protein
MPNTTQYKRTGHTNTGLMTTEERKFVTETLYVLSGIQITIVAGYAGTGDEM